MLQKPNGEIKLHYDNNGLQTYLSKNETLYIFWPVLKMYKIIIDHTNFD